ncbi:MAG TPA: TldD/PmbA family protein [Candidatus Bathyarchaeia archaeon]|nr:TldD/PmbA family protein [Candidatus Bathyarchaeia archaeon]
MTGDPEQEAALLAACKRALALLDVSVYQGEAFATHSNSVSAELEKGKIKSSQSGFESGIGIRIFKDGSLGYAHASLERAESAVVQAVSAARAGRADKDFKSLPLPDRYPAVSGTWDKAIASLDVSAVAQLAIDVADASRIDKSIDIINSGASIGRWSGAIANTLGVVGTDSGTQAGLEVDVVAHKEGASGNGFEYAASRHLDLDVDAIGVTAGEMALHSINPQPIQSGKMPVVLDPLAVGSVIAAGVAVSAEDAQRDRSFLTGRIGERIATEEFTIVDDGLLSGGLETSPFDAEGVPSQRTPLVERGILRSFLYDSYTANKEGVKSTGNAARGDFRQPPSISPTNLVISAGADANVVEDVRRGIYIRATGDRPNASTGEFSGMVYAGHAIENGELSHALKQTNIGINILDLLQQIDGISREVKTYFSLTAPTIRVLDVSVASSG